MLLVASALVVFAAVMISIARPSLYAETGKMSRHGVRAALAAVSIGVMSAPGESAALPVPPTTIGVNLSAPTYFLGTRVLANLASAAGWGASDHRVLGPEDIDKDGSVKRVAAGVEIYRLMTLPNVGTRTATIRCTWKGKGEFRPRARRVQSVSPGKGSFTFTLNNAEPLQGGNPMLGITSVDPSDPIRDLDCRETTMPASARFDPAYLESLRGFKVIRFMDWQNSNGNVPVTWATRHLPNWIDNTGADGVAIEDMIELAKQTGADPWFNMPWNADDDYYERFARMVHDSLPADRTIYVELGNEVWNHAFSVAGQAQKEGLAANLSSDPNEAGLRRYAQRLAHVLDIWKKVYADRPGRLVRVAACQNGDWCAKAVLGFGDTARHIDALATAPYFGGPLSNGAFASPDDLFVALDHDIDRTFANTLQAKAIAAQYGKRYIAYEGGQHLIFKDVEFEQRIERDPRMYDAYKKYLGLWRSKIGDTIALYNSSGPVRPFGAWGLVEYVGQPMSETPKMRAVLDEIARGAGKDVAH